MITTFKTHLVSKKQLTSDVYLLRFQLIQPNEVLFVAGQYMILFCPNNSDLPARRLFSIVTPPSQKDSFDLLVKIIPGGVASEYFLKMQLQEEVTFQGPAGMFTLRQTPKHKLFLVTGTGVAPVFSMLETHLANDSKTNYTLFWGLRHFKDVYLLETLEDIAKRFPNFKFSIYLSREENLDTIPADKRSFFSTGRVTAGFEKTLTDYASYDYYLCGDRAVVESLRQLLLSKNIEKPSIIFEKF